MALQDAKLMFSKSPTILELIRGLGIRGLAKSAFYSKRHTDSLASLILSKATYTDISPDATFTTESPFFFGLSPGGARKAALQNSFLTIEESGKLIVENPEEIVHIGKGAKVGISGEFRIGDGSYISDRSTINCSNKIIIGDSCAISWDVELMDDDFHQMEINGNNRPQSAPILIEDHVWIGSQATILKGVTIGDGAVVASNSVVTQDIPANTLVGGVPAEIIEENVSWE